MSSLPPVVGYSYNQQPHTIMTSPLLIKMRREADEVGRGTDLEGGDEDSDADFEAVSEECRELARERRKALEFAVGDGPVISIFSTPSRVRVFPSCGELVGGFDLDPPVHAAPRPGPSSIVRKMTHAFKFPTTLPLANLDNPELIALALLNHGENQAIAMDEVLDSRSLFPQSPSDGIECPDFSTPGSDFENDFSKAESYKKSARIAKIVKIVGQVLFAIGAICTALLLGSSWILIGLGAALGAGAVLVSLISGTSTAPLGVSAIVKSLEKVAEIASSSILIKLMALALSVMTAVGGLLWLGGSLAESSYTNKLNELKAKYPGQI